MTLERKVELGFQGEKKAKNQNKQPKKTPKVAIQSK